MQRRFQQVDVFTEVAYRGNPLAVVVDGDGLTVDEMQRFANWTNLSETTFLLPPSDPAADYRVRIFTTTWELPFAGHPTLGSCRAWLDNGGRSRRDDGIVQECGVGLVTIRRRGERLAFEAPPLIRSGPVEGEILTRVHNALGVEPVDLAWIDNGPGWIGALLPTADGVLALEPDFGGTLDLKLGVAGPTGSGNDLEVRAFFPGPAAMEEDPVTGSLNASLAQWVMERDPAITAYTAHQGARRGRHGRIYIERDPDGAIWVGGDVVTCITGTVEL